MRTQNPAIVQTYCWALGVLSTVLFSWSLSPVKCFLSTVTLSTLRIKVRRNVQRTTNLLVGVNHYVRGNEMIHRAATCPLTPNKIVFTCRLCEDEMLSPYWIYFWTTPCRALVCRVEKVFRESDFSDSCFKNRKNFALRAIIICRLGRSLSAWRNLCLKSNCPRFIWTPNCRKRLAPNVCV